jgi:hypothetical protein
MLIYLVPIKIWYSFKSFWCPLNNTPYLIYISLSFIENLYTTQKFIQECILAYIEFCYFKNHYKYFQKYFQILQMANSNNLDRTLNNPISKIKKNFKEFFKEFLFIL